MVAFRNFSSSLTLQHSCQILLKCHKPMTEGKKETQETLRSAEIGLMALCLLDGCADVCTGLDTFANITLSRRIQTSLNVLIMFWTYKTGPKWTKKVALFEALGIPPAGLSLPAPLLPSCCIDVFIPLSIALTKGVSSLLKPFIMMSKY